MVVNNELITKLYAYYNTRPTNENKWAIIGIRGATPISSNEIGFLPVDYMHPRCTIILYNTASASSRPVLLLGSTVPHSRYVRTAQARNGIGANEVVYGNYTRGFKKGWHKWGSNSGHRALRQNTHRIIRRTADDTDYDGDDRVEFSNPYDNFHAAWNMGPDHPYYASAGCTVVSGYPECKSRGSKPNTGDWAKASDILYRERNQEDFDYFLVPALAVYRLGRGGRNKTRVFYGSRGSVVADIQGKLGLSSDGVAGRNTINAVMKFQEEAFGTDADDGIVGPMTAEALGVSLPEI